MSYKKMVALLMFLAFQLQASTINAHITADNAFALYTGNADGTVLSYIGRNTADWNVTQSFTFNHADGDFLYLAAWSDGAVAQGIIGEFDLEDGSTILTGTSWNVHLNSNGVNNGNFNYMNFLPQTSDVQSEIGLNNWVAVPNTVDNGSGPWGTVSNISPDAKWMWGSEMLSNGSGVGEYQIFRIQTASVPEPGMFMLIGMGMAGLSVLGLRIRRKK
jgi:hypothetical protein